MRFAFSISTIRLLLIARQTWAQRKSQSEFEEFAFTGSSGRQLNYTLFKPVVGRNVTLPFVLPLHGVGGREKDGWEKRSAGHGDWGLAYKNAELWEWLFAQKRK